MDPVFSGLEIAECERPAALSRRGILKLSFDPLPGYGLGQTIGPAQPERRKGPLPCARRTG